MCLCCKLEEKKNKEKEKKEKDGEIPVMNVTDCFRCSSRVMIKHKISANFG